MQNLGFIVPFREPEQFCVMSRCPTHDTCLHSYMQGYQGGSMFMSLYSALVKALAQDLFHRFVATFAF